MGEIGSGEDAGSAGRGTALKVSVLRQDVPETPCSPPPARALRSHLLGVCSSAVSPHVHTRKGAASSQQNKVKWEPEQWCPEQEPPGPGARGADSGPARATASVPSVPPPRPPLLLRLQQPLPLSHHGPLSRRRRAHLHSPGNALVGSPAARVPSTPLPRPHLAAQWPARPPPRPVPALSVPKSQRTGYCFRSGRGCSAAVRTASGASNPCCPCPRHRLHVILWVSQL